jgi:hypothetical protein
MEECESLIAIFIFSVAVALNCQAEDLAFQYSSVQILLTDATFLLLLQIAFISRVHPPVRTVCYTANKMDNGDPLSSLLHNSL